MSRKKGPALYELINPTGSSHVPTPMQVQTSHEDVDDENLTHNVLTPGRSVRMSIGTFGVIASVVLAMVVISYTLGLIVVKLSQEKIMALDFFRKLIHLVWQ